MEADFVLNLRFQSIEFGDADRIIKRKLQGGSLGECSGRQQPCAKRHRIGGLGRLGYVVDGSFSGPECQRPNQRLCLASLRSAGFSNREVRRSKLRLYGRGFIYGFGSTNRGAEACVGESGDG